MALKLQLSANENPTGTDAVELYVRGSGLVLDLAGGTALAPFLGYANASARAANKHPIVEFQGVKLAQIPQPPRYDPQTGEKIADAVPSLQQVLAAFPDEFNRIATILYRLAIRHDPKLKHAQVNQDDFDAALVTEIDTKLDAIQV